MEKRLIKLVDDFTTPEQSQELLELGIPADSADCFYDKEFFDGDVIQIRKGFNWSERHNLSTGTFKDVVTPCWSLGRLLRVYAICTGARVLDVYPCDNMIEDTINNFRLNKSSINYKNLEEHL